MEDGKEKGGGKHHRGLCSERFIILRADRLKFANDAQLSCIKIKQLII